MTLLKGKYQMTFLAWPEIEAFHHIRKFLRVDPGEWWRAKEQLSGTSTVSYRCKVKLHGTNSAIQIHTDGTIVCQSRTNIITPENDNAGFARWVMSNANMWHNSKDGARAQVIVYGEWIGPGIQKNVAVSEISKKCFAVFAARPLDASDNPLDDILWVEPEVLEGIVQGIPDTYVLPWYSHPVAHGYDTHMYAQVNVDWRQSDEELTKSTAQINDWVMAIEANDPWVKATFNVDGTGEGLVFYPVSEPHLGWENFQNLCFKAKGEKHKNIKTAAPAQVNAEAAASIDAFVDLVLTSARLEQGATAVGGYDLKLTGKFLTWCLTDVEKECQDELAASNLTWKEVLKPISEKARAWYLVKAKQ